jgi:hypothetical protein
MEKRTKRRQRGCETSPEAISPSSIAPRHVSSLTTCKHNRASVTSLGDLVELALGSFASSKRARNAETLKQPSLCLKLRASYFYPD